MRPDGSRVRGVLVGLAVAAAPFAAALDVEYQADSLLRLARDADLVVTVSGAEPAEGGDRDVCYRLQWRHVLYGRKPDAEHVVACGPRALAPSPETSWARQAAFLRLAAPREGDAGPPRFHLLGGRYGVVEVHPESLGPLQEFLRLHGSPEDAAGWAYRHVSASDELLVRTSAFVLAERLPADPGGAEALRQIVLKAESPAVRTLAVGLVAQSLFRERPEWLASIARESAAPEYLREAAVQHLARDAAGLEQVRRWSLTPDSPLSGLSRRLLRERITAFPLRFILEEAGTGQVLTPHEWDGVDLRVREMSLHRPAEAAQAITALAPIDSGRAARLLGEVATAAGLEQGLRIDAARGLVRSPADERDETLSRVERLAPDADVRALAEEALQERHAKEP